MKAILRVKEVVEYERLYEVECLSDIEDEEDLKDLLDDINTNLALYVSDGVASCAVSEHELFESVFDCFKDVSEKQETKSDGVSKYLIIPDDMTLEKSKIKTEVIKCEI